VIGIYDSGVGGLHVLSALQKHLGEDYGFCYLADTEMIPLGQKSPTEIKTRMEQACEWFFRNNCSLVLLACNTASVVSIRHLQTEWLGNRYPARNVLGINIPLLEYMQTHHSGLRTKPGIVLSTAATYATRFYEVELRARGFSQIHGIGCSRLPLAIEKQDEALISHELRYIADKFLTLGAGEQPAYIVHACTHFPLINHMFEQSFAGVRLIDHADWTARQLVAYLHKHPSYVPAPSPARYFATGDQANLRRVLHAQSNKKQYEVGVAQIGK
jgi:glutamate racemase